MQDIRSDAQTYRTRADELRAIVQAMTDEKDRELIIKIAQEYDAMAAAMAVLDRA